MIILKTDLMAGSGPERTHPDLTHDLAKRIALLQPIA